MSNTILMFLGSYVMFMMVIGLGLTVWEFRKVERDQPHRSDANRTIDLGKPVATSR